MITIIPALEIMRAVTDKNITGQNANIRREAFTSAIELKSLADIKVLIEGILYDKVEGRIENEHKVFFASICSIDNSAKDVTDYNITKAINWIAKSESKVRKVIIITDNVSSYSESENDNTIILTSIDFVYRVKKILEVTKKKTRFSIDEFLLAVFFFN